MEESEIRTKLEKGYIRSTIIIELLGAPKDHLEETLRLVLKKLKEEAGVDVLSGKVHPAKAQDKLFSIFAELDILFKDLTVLTRICFDYMPSSVEIIEPEQFKLPCGEFSSFINDILSLLHGIDFKLKEANAANALLERNSANLLKNIVLSLLEQGGKSAQDLSIKTGIKPEQLEPFLAAFSQEGLIRKRETLWEQTR